MKKKLLNFSALSAIAPIIISPLVSLTSCGAKTVNVDVDQKRLSTDIRGLTMFKMSTEAEIQSGDTLEADITYSDKKELVPSIEGISKPWSRQDWLFAITKMEAAPGHTITEGETISFNIKIVCKDNNNKVRWQSFINDLSMTFHADESKDTDLDGLVDIVDPEPNNNLYTGIMNCYSMQPLEFRMNYGDLIDKDATKYDIEFAKLGSILSTDAYSPDNIKINGQLFSGKDRLAKQIGAADWEEFNLRDERDSYKHDKNDTTYFTVCHHDMMYKGKDDADEKLYKVVFISFEGTSGNEEWVSDFDVGMDDSSYYAKVKVGDETGTREDHPDWVKSNDDINALHTKGICVAMNRAINKLEGENGYFKRHNINLSGETENVILFINGHSRGAGITNLLAARYLDSMSKGDTNYAGLKKVYGYCYATPFTTFDSNADNEKYKSIHCIVNDDDFVGKVPFERWGLHKYGQKHICYVSQNHKTDFETKWKECDDQDHTYYYFNHFLELIETLPVNERKDLYNLEQGTTLDKQTFVTNLYKYTEDEASLKISGYIDYLRALDMLPFFKLEKLGNDVDGYDVICTNCGGGLIALASNFFLKDNIPLTPLIEIIPLLWNYKDYAINLVENLSLAILETGNDNFIMDFGNCCHNCPTYYYAVNNIDETK